MRAMEFFDPATGESVLSKTGNESVFIDAGFVKSKPDRLDKLKKTKRTFDDKRKKSKK